MLTSNLTDYEPFMWVGPLDLRPRATNCESCRIAL